MAIGVCSYAYRWAVRTGQMDAFALLDRAHDAGVEVVQICDNLPLDGLPEGTLADLAQRLAQLSDDLAAHDTAASEGLMEVVGDIEAFKGTVEADLEELNVTLSDLQLLGGIMTDLEELSAGLDKAQSEIQGDVEEAKDEQLGRSTVNMGLLILVLIMAVVLVLMVLRTHRSSPPPKISAPRDGEEVYIDEVE